MVDTVKKFKGLSRELIALRIANELEDGSYVNLGIGIPTLVSDWIEGRDIVLQAELGMLNTGPLASREDVEQDLINASCQPVTELPGSSYFSENESFAMIRGGYMDVAVLGALQVSEKGDLAGWSNPERGLPEEIGNIGGSMDLAVGARKVIIAMMHTTNDGDYKIRKECTYPLTAQGVVDLIVTDLAVIEVTKKGLLLREVAPGVSAEDVQSVTEPELIVSRDLQEIQL
ncbi:MAG: succinyl-CoA--3-ketoacid-CoA transferase [Chloroflexi bacterium RBG_13_51_52]|nr:MAG: succinyl-CoA--3-ketoacid-CoA transferase [Chloroflexi bacterium RBG_13_51_52]